MSIIDDILKVIFVIALAIVVLDVFMEKTLPDYSILEFVYNIIYLLGCLWTWLGIALIEITYGDFITPLQLLLRIFLIFMVVVLDTGADLFFDLITFPFQLIQDVVGDSLIFEIVDLPIVYASFDVATFTFRAGVGINLSITELNLEILDMELLFQVSVLGTDQTSILVAGQTIHEYSRANDYWVFSSLGLVGFQVSFDITVAAMYSLLPIDEFSASLENEVKRALNDIFKQYSTPKDLYDYLIDYLE